MSDVSNLNSMSTLVAGLGLEICFKYKLKEKADFRS